MTEFMRWGATPAEWRYWAENEGGVLLPFLLPVVSNPNAQISPGSSLRAIGKTPSIYNTHGKVVGIKAWTNKVTTAADVEAWSQNPDYGICIQTRLMRAIDIDVENYAAAAEIENAWQDWLYRQTGGFAMVRYRDNSARRLLVLIAPGDFPKRVVRVAGGMVEILGDGQQFVAAGTHISGEKYQWRIHQSMLLT